MISDTPAIEVANLTKRYPGETVPALDDLNLTVERGEIFGYLGPNGAGKTTTIRLMLDFIRPTSGQIRILGLDPATDSTAVRHLTGNLPGELRLWDHLTGRQTLRYLAGLRPGCDLDFACQLAERLNLKLNMKAGSYSTGNKRKLGLIQAMMHRPPLLILDEPTTGLDPLTRQTFHELLCEVQEEGRTVFLSSHILSEVQAMCDRVGILRGGVLQVVERIQNLQINVERLVTIYSHDALIPEAWEALEGVRQVSVGPGYITLTVTGSMDTIIKYAARHQVNDMRIEVAGLEHIFMEFYND